MGEREGGMAIFFFVLRQGGGQGEGAKRGVMPAVKSNDDPGGSREGERRRKSLLR